MCCLYTFISYPSKTIVGQAVKTKDTRLLVGRVLRQTASIRKTLEPSVFRDFLNEALPSTSRAKALCLPLIEQVGLNLLSVLKDAPRTSFLQQVHSVTHKK